MRPALVSAFTLTVLFAPAFGGAQDASNSAPSPTNSTDKRLLTPEEQGRQGVVNGVMEQPFRDFNVIRTKIPRVLIRAIADPYERPQPGCAGIATDVAALNTALGPDLDEPVSTEHPGTLTRAEGSARTGALDAMRSGIQSEIPFDGFIRVLTGAQRHDKLVMAAIQAGAIRRGYLKGLGESLHCTLPAAPRHLAHPVDLSTR
ncbi:MAG TPA: hypothetical protein VMU37_07100 [Caulobacteraceae bacterium]|nr:hypothetical protein [Caulobacteraceae bacterium]